MRDDIVAVTMIKDRDVKYLDNMIYSLYLNDTQVVVVDMNEKEVEREKVRSVVEEFKGIRIEAPIPFSLSRGFNIGIRNSPESKYLLCTGAEMVFSPGVVETIVGKLNSSKKEYAMVVSVCGFLPEGIEVTRDKVQFHWEELKESIILGSNIKMSPGTFQATMREWLFKIRGYDEGLPFAFVDSDILRRANVDGLPRGGLRWKEGQVLHQWHPTSELIGKLGGTLKYVEGNNNVIRNLSGWGEV